MNMPMSTSQQQQGNSSSDDPFGESTNIKVNDIIREVVYNDDNNGDGASQHDEEYGDGDDDDDNIEDTFSMGSHSTVSDIGTTAAETQASSALKAQERGKLFALLVIIVGSCAAAIFLYAGITNEKDTNASNFERRSTDLTSELQNAMRDYERSCSWIHESTRNWRHDSNPRQRFRELYNYVSDGLDFFAMQWIPNITHAERPAVEAETANYFANVSMIERGFDNQDYYGFYGITPDNGFTDFVPVEDKPYYFPIQFDEPLASFGVIHYDVYTAPWEGPSIDLALSTWKAAATPTFKLVGHSEHESFSTVIYHPGVPVEGIQPRDLSTMLVHIQSFLERAMRYQSESLAVYLFDETDDMKYIGGMSIEVSKDDEDEDNQDDNDLSFYADGVQLSDIESSYRLHTRAIEFASRVWVAQVVPIDDSFENSYTGVIVGAVLIFGASILLAIWMVYNTRRSIQMHRLMKKAAAAEASIVANLFPKNVRDRMLRDADTKGSKMKDKIDRDRKDAFRVGRNTLGSEGGLTSEDIFGSKPIADLHPYTTIMFADLVGFTAWSSVREPTQVFTLLEVVYHAFDKLTTQKRVFKVETVGDCYVAVAGLPEPRKDHAVVMARLAQDCLIKSQRVFKALETLLGPDTGELAFRIGLHSGQVTAGVLRGDKGRFQLFGDTVNTASRIETTGVRNKVHCSQETADLLKAAGYEKWLTPREDEVHLKGKGPAKTFFVRVLNGSVISGMSANSNRTGMESDEVDAAPKGEKTDRLVQWNVEVLSGLLKKIMRRRLASGKKIENSFNSDYSFVEGNHTVLEEVQEKISLPAFDGKAIRKQEQFESFEIDRAVRDELTVLITNIAAMYRDNSFHNYEHASHVTMSIIKMMSRIIDPKEVEANRRVVHFDQEKVEAELHDHTFGITSDPLTQFAAAFSGLIHDIDHQGVPNATLVKEGSPLAEKYNDKSVAEQNSVDLAWQLLMSPQYDNLRNCICCDEEEVRRFRQLVVNSVMATDIMDKELGAARVARWNTAFSEDQDAADGKENVNRKATIVIEHLIQASDVSHTMQHWHVYVRWNERLFHELYEAYQTGRIENDPTTNWFKGEIGFFDYYVIPLAKKLKTCGVFGVSSDEFLIYAEQNRKEWEKKGEKLIQQYLKNYSRRSGK